MEDSLELAAQFHPMIGGAFAEFDEIASLHQGDLISNGGHCMAIDLRENFGTGFIFRVYLAERDFG